MLSDSQHARIVNVVQAKFRDSHVVRSILLNVQTARQDLVADHRILALVDNQSSYGFFVLISEHTVPEDFTDLTIERAIPIDNNFVCDTDSIPNLQSHIIYNIKYNKELLSFKVEIGFASAQFATEVIKAKENHYSQSSQNHKWLEQFYAHKLIGNFNMEDEMHSDISVSRQKISQDGGISTTRESILKIELDNKKSEYTHQEQFTLFVGTWNVNGKPPPTNPNILREWLENEPDPPDIYAIGFQELDLSKEAFIFNDTVREAEWQRALDMSIHSGARYRLVGLARLVGIQLAVMINYRHYEHVTNVCTDTAGTGILGKMGNKGGVAVSFQLHDTNLCFVNCHLAAHAEEVERRNQDYKEIDNRICFRRSHYYMTIRDHDQVYWLGDFNYRIKKFTASEVKQYLSFGDLESLLAYDQLTEQKSIGRILPGYNEAEIKFHPTYKYDVDTDRYDSSEKARVPSWTDRIFSRGKGIRQVSYMCHMGLKISDHKPVYAKFSSEISIINKDKYRKVHEDLLKGLDKLENEYLPQVDIDTRDIHFEQVKFREPQSKYIIVANTGMVTVVFRFIGKDDYAPICKSWLKITPATGQIIPGDKCDIQFEIDLDESPKSNQLEDILILHLDNGKDLFISVSADCIRTSFMMSISALCKCPVPILQLTEEQYKNASLDQSAILYQVPRELWHMVDFLYRNGLKTRDLFEVAALREEINQIRDWLDNGSLDPMPGGIHAVAECLLIFLSYTQDPVVPYRLQNKCADVSDYFISCKEVLDSFPPLHRNVFLYICMFLQELIKYKNENGLERHNLSVLFSSLLMRSPEKNSPMPVCRKKTKFIEQFLSNDLGPLVTAK